MKVEIYRKLQYHDVCLSNVSTQIKMRILLFVYFSVSVLFSSLFARTEFLETFYLVIQVCYTKFIVTGVLQYIIVVNFWSLSPSSSGLRCDIVFIYFVGIIDFRFVLNNIIDFIFIKNRLYLGILYQLCVLSGISSS